MTKTFIALLKLQLGPSEIARMKAKKPETSLTAVDIYIKLPNSHVQVHHSTGCEDSLCAKAGCNTLAIFTKTS